MIALVDRLRRDEGLTVLVSIHTPEELGDAADLMAFIADGRVVAVAPPAGNAASRPAIRPSTAISANEDALAGALDAPHIHMMKRYLVIAAAVGVVALIAALIVPMWVMTADVSLPPGAIGAHHLHDHRLLRGRRRADVPCLLQRPQRL